MSRPGLTAAWTLALAAAVGVRLWNALLGPLMWGYDAWGHVAYVLFLDVYGGVPWADQGWSYFHPPLHYALGWALAQLGSAEALARGLSLLGSAASLGTAGLAAWLVGAAFPGRPWLALLGFGCVAFLPVQLFMSPMPGNELTAGLLTAAALCVFVANELRQRPGLAADAGTGALLGAGLLTKFSGLVPLLALLAALGLRWWLDPDRRSRGARTLARGALLAGVAVALAGPYYARNLAAFGTPFELSRGYPLVASVERDQPPGARTWSHYFKLPWRLFAEPNPLAPHLLDSVWGSVYLNTWGDSYRESDVERALVAQRRQQRTLGAMAALGLLPTGLALAGAGLSARDFWRGERRAVLAPVGLLAAAGLSAFVVFSWQVPLWSALKASYLSPLALPCAVFVARSALAIAAAGGSAAAAALGTGLAGVAAAASLVATEGALQPRRADAPATGALRFYFGELGQARRVYGRLIEGSGYPVAWLESLAAVELADGRPQQARRLYARAAQIARRAGRSDPYRPGRLAVATALAGDREAALALLDAALAADPRAELRANRGVLRAAAGDPAGAARDLRAALAEAPEMTPAWLALERVERSLGREAEALRARRAALRWACRAPRGFPYAVGTGEVIEWGVDRRPLLLLRGQDLRPARPGDYRQLCARLREAR